jgi:hypothetical protein
VPAPTTPDTPTTVTLDWFETSYPNENLGVGDTLVFDFGPPHNVYQFVNLGKRLLLSPFLRVLCLFFFLLALRLLPATQTLKHAEKLEPLF